MAEERGWSIDALRQEMREIGWEAQRQADFLELERPYSSPPPARHPVWSDELRTESAVLRAEGLLDAEVLHPWEADPQQWPSTDPALQESLLGVAEDRQAFESIRAEFEGSVPSLIDVGAVHVSGDAVQTAKDYILTDGYSGKARETEWAAAWMPTTLDAERQQATVSPGTQVAQTAAGELRAFFTTRDQAREREGLAW